MFHLTLVGPNGAKISTCSVSKNVRDLQAAIDWCREERTHQGCEWAKIELRQHGRDGDLVYTSDDRDPPGC